MAKTFTLQALMPTTSHSNRLVNYEIPQIVIHILTNISQSQKDVERGLGAAKKAGLNVMRTWGFNDRNATTDPNGFPKYGGEGAGETDIVLQTWKNGKAKMDLKGFDKVVKGAEKTNMKLIVALTNNWADYGGMDVYTVNLGGKYHDDVSKAFGPSRKKKRPVFGL